mmetsp:Transcript_20833/g.62704  ORF Transcript_20833/g.62704 Transcript_20833/m.62704 type:complete len:269 (+) Transcript_20833:157-963(+)
MTSRSATCTTFERRSPSRWSRRPCCSQPSQCSPRPLLPQVTTWTVGSWTCVERLMRRCCRVGARCRTRSTTGRWARSACGVPHGRCWRPCMRTHSSKSPRSAPWRPTLERRAIMPTTAKWSTSGSWASRSWPTMSTGPRAPSSRPASFKRSRCVWALRAPSSRRSGRRPRDTEWWCHACVPAKQVSQTKRLLCVSRPSTLLGTAGPWPSGGQKAPSPPRVARGSPRCTAPSCATTSRRPAPSGAPWCWRPPPEPRPGIGLARTPRLGA